MKKLKEGKIELGNTIELGHVIYATDPCYEIDTWGQSKISVAPGRYITSQYLFDEGDWGERVGLIVAYHEQYSKESTSQLETLEYFGETIGVDSGQAGFVDAKYFDSIWETGSHDEFYDKKVETFGPAEVALTGEEHEGIKSYLREFEEMNNNLKHVLLSDASDEVKKEAHFRYVREVSKKDNEFFAKFGQYPTPENLIKETKIVGRPLISTPDYKGVFTSTGYGDGAYPLYVAKNSSGDVVGLAIDYLEVLGEFEESE